MIMSTWKLLGRIVKGQICLQQTINELEIELQDSVDLR